MLQSQLILMLSIMLFSFSSWAQTEILTLEQCIHSALENNPEIQIARSELAAAQQQTRQNHAQMYPKLDFSSSYRHQSIVPEIDMGSKIFVPIPLTIEPVQIGAFDQYETKVSVTQAIFTGFRLRNALRAAEAKTEATNAQLAKTQSELIYRTKSSYLNVLKAQKILQIAEVAKEQVSAHLRDINNFVEQGLAKKSELLQAAVKLSETELAVVQAQHAVRLAAAALENVTGLVLENSPKLENRKVSNFVVPNLEESIKKALSQRSELKVVKHNHEAAKWAVNIAKGEKLPSIAAFGSYAYGKPGLDFVRNEWMDYWIVGVGAEWNLWNWGATDAKKEQAQLFLKKLENTDRRIQHAIELEVTQACLKMREAYERIQVTQKLVAQAKENYRVIENGYQQGQNSNTDYLDAQIDLTRAQIEHAQTEIDYLIAKAFWEKAMGSPHASVEK